MKETYALEPGNNARTNIDKAIERQLEKYSVLEQEKLPGAEADQERSHIPTIHRVHFLKTTWFRYAAAVLVIIGIGAYLYTAQKIKPVPEKIAVVQDVSAPESNRAMLTLANGQTIFLDSAHNGILAKEGETNIEKTEEGNIVYQGNRPSGAMQYNTLSVPRGSQIASIILSDGSKVYLNAESSLKYPVAFNGTERKVEITGEAYFEISKNAKSKFVVVNGQMRTEVLGTSFNVNGYNDEGGC